MTAGVFGTGVLACSVRHLFPDLVNQGSSREASLLLLLLGGGMEGKRQPLLALYGLWNEPAQGLREAPGVPAWRELRACGGFPGLPPKPRTLLVAQGVEKCLPSLLGPGLASCITAEEVFFSKYINYLTSFAGWKV